MKKLTLVALVCLMMTACTASSYANKGNATVLTSKFINNDAIELTIQKDNGQVITMFRKYDGHVTVGSRVNVNEEYNQQDSDLISITRYEFK